VFYSAWCRFFSGASVGVPVAASDASSVERKLEQFPGKFDSIMNNDVLWLIISLSSSIHNFSKLLHFSF